MSPAPLAALRSIANNRPQPSPYERCELCGAPVADVHSHVVNTESRSLLCACRPCYLLFTADGATLKFRAVPDRYLSFPDFQLSPGQWDDLAIPVGMAFFLANSALGRTVAFYPGPAGAAESELALDAWEQVRAANPELATVRPDVEALLIRADGTSFECYLVPIDACYELVGHLRLCWRGFDGGSEARAKIRDFFAAMQAKSRPVRKTRPETLVSGEPAP